MQKFKNYCIKADNIRVFTYSYLIILLAYWGDEIVLNNNGVTKMNKKILAAACGLVISSGFAMADDMNFYVGGDLGYSKHGYSSELKDTVALANGKIKSKVPTFGLFVGGKFHENFGAEIGYTFFKKAKITFPVAALDSSIKTDNMYADALGYMPVASCCDLIGSVGIGRIKLKASGVALNGSEHKVGFRLGAGAQYKFADHFAARAMIRYQNANIKANNGTKLYKNNTAINLGLTYTI